MELANKGRDGNIPGKDDWRSGKSSIQIVKIGLTEQRKEMDEWLSHPEHKLDFEDEDLVELERLELEALAFAFKDIFSTSHVPGGMRRVEFEIEFKEAIVKPLRERVRRCSPHVSLCHQNGQFGDLIDFGVSNFQDMRNIFLWIWTSQICETFGWHARQG